MQEDQLDIFPDKVLLRREDRSKNMRRFYLMTVQRDLFGGASLIREWGRVGSPGKLRVEHHRDEGHAVDEPDRVYRRRFSSYSAARVTVFRLS